MGERMAEILQLLEPLVFPLQIILKVLRKVLADRFVVRSEADRVLAGRPFCS